MRPRFSLATDDASIGESQRDLISVWRAAHVRCRRGRRSGEHFEIADDRPDLVGGAPAGRHDAAWHAVADDLEDAIVVGRRANERREIRPIEAAAVGAVTGGALLAEQRSALVDKRTRGRGLWRCGQRDGFHFRAGRFGGQESRRSPNDRAEKDGAGECDTAHWGGSILRADEDTLTRPSPHGHRRSWTRRCDCRCRSAAKQLRRRHAGAARRQGRSPTRFTKASPSKK